MLDTVAKRKHSFPLNLKPRKSKQAKTLSLSEYNLVTKLLVWQIALLGRLHYSSAFVLLHLNYSSNYHLWWLLRHALLFHSYLQWFIHLIWTTHICCASQFPFDFSPLLRPLTPVFLSFAVMQKCHVKNKDIGKFLDGIYVRDKGATKEE